MDRIRNRAEEAYPEECCGFLTGYVEGGTGAEIRTGTGAGSGSRDGAAPLTVRVLEEIPARNAAAAGDRRREFLVEPEDLLNVMKRYRDRDEDVVGFYHSHPDHEAELSPTDLKFARLWPRTVWLIVPVAEDGEGGAPRAGRERAWWLSARPEKPRTDRTAGEWKGPEGTRDAQAKDVQETEMQNVQEMTIRSSGSAEERAETAGEATAPPADRAITPREERA